MSYQNWTPTVLNKYEKTNEKDLKKNALNDKSAQGFAKTGGKGLDGKHLHKILESESFEVPQMTLELRHAISEARQKKDWKQKDLAMACGVKEQIISHYESGKAVPENSMIAKMEKALQCKLPRPGKHKTDDN